MSVITKVSLEEQMKANPGLDKTAIAELKQWNSQQTHLPQLSDADLALFYLNNTYDTDATRSNINNYFVMRHYMPEYFVVHKDLQSSELKKAFDSVFVVSLPQRTNDHHKVILARLMDTDPTNYSFENAIKVMNMVMDAAVYEDGPDNKYVFVFDLNGVTMEHLKTLNWTGMQKFYEYVRKGSPVRWIGAHYTNSSTSSNSELHESIKTQIMGSNFPSNSMIRFHSDMDSLIGAIGMEYSMLPKEMGGKAGPAMDLQKQQIKKLESHDAFFVNLENKVKLVNTDNIPSARTVFGIEETL